MGSCNAIPILNTESEDHTPPKLKWYQLYYGNDTPAGDLLASFELIHLTNKTNLQILNKFPKEIELKMEEYYLEVFIIEKN
jgi:hypothetical protein